MCQRWRDDRFCCLTVAFQQNWPVFFVAPLWVELFVFLFWIYTPETGHLIYVLSLETRHYITKTAGEIYFTSSLVKCKCTGDEWCVELRLQGQHCANVDFETVLFHSFSNKSCNEREIGKKHEEMSNDYFLNDPISWNICDSSKWLDDLVMWPREHIIHKGLNSLHQWVPRTPRWSPAGEIIYFHYSFHK